MLRAFADVECRLYDIVAERVLEQDGERRRAHEFVDHPEARGDGARAKAFFDDIGRKLLRAELSHVRAEFVAQLALDVGKAVKLEHVLDDIVAIRVAHERVAVLGDLADELIFLALGRVVDAALQHAAAVAVRGHLDAALGDGVVNELIVLGRQAMQTALDDVVAVQVLDEQDDAGAQRLGDERHVRRRRQKLDHLLHGARAVHVFRDGDELRAHQLDNLQALRLVAMLEQLLAQVVAERIDHQLDNVLVNFGENELRRAPIVFVELLLQKTAAVLVLAQRVDLAEALIERDKRARILVVSRAQRIASIARAQQAVGARRGRRRIVPTAAAASARARIATRRAR
jgi:hypothetical protein